MDELINVILDYRIDGEPVSYSREITSAQLAELIVQFDEMADEHE